MSSSAEQKSKLSGIFSGEYNNLVQYVKGYFRGDGKADAEDIVQDVVLSLYKRIDFNAPIENLLGYLYRSLRNRVIDIQRRKKEPLLSEFDDDDSGNNFLLVTMEKENQGAEDEEQYEERSRLMFQKLEELRPDQQEIIIRTELEGYTFDELSKEWGIPIGTLLSRKHRAMARLQKLMLNKPDV
ncbi:MAG: sigma-70 family RNA polymerase sigma factor [Bacteroidales bacterium]|nr:sigma-70 family RNA polymerase sigma factor [Bacteroidales bacterium]